MVVEATPAEGPSGYPVTVEVEYPAQLSRLSTFFRIILAIPVLIVIGILGGGELFGAATDGGFALSAGALGSLIVVHWIAVFLRRRPVTWLFDAIVAIQRFSLRGAAYFLLLTDRYPPFEGDGAVRYEVERPTELSRWKLLIWKTIVSIPHVIILIVLWLVVLVVVLISWIAILFTARYPKGLHDLVSGWLRWGARVGAYWMSLTDEYPPFSFD